MTNSTKYVAVDVTLPDGMKPEDAAADILSAELFAIGAAGVEVQDDHDPVMFVVSFEAGDDAKTIASVYEALDAAGVDASEVTLRALEPIDWSEHWKQHFVPLTFGDLCVVPTWLEPPAEAKVILRIDPSSAFGTGQHVSTGSCLDRIVERRPETAVLDVGTGTGILALAALLMGATRAVGIDNDPEAVLVARENAEKNGLTDRTDFSETPLSDITEAFDFVVANILAGPLIEMAPMLAARVAPGGTLALSGILETQGQSVADAYVATGLILDKIEVVAEWVRVDLHRA